MNKEPETVEREEERSSAAVALGEVIIGTLVAIDEQGRLRVDFPGSPVDEPLVAITTLGLRQQHLGRQVALLFANGDLHQPIVMGMIHSPLQAMLDSYEQSVQANADGVAIESDLNVDDVEINGKRMVFEAQEEMVFKCGESSITLTKSGKVLIRGKYLLNRSSGVNRIMGGSVQVN
ncbi:MAG: phage baseplate assembly protein V [Gammaproteobacteria bacterium]|nr:phage baseplate assembly protein V [Gammaproteobacteria bacterium]